MSHTPSQKALSIVPHFSAAFSMYGSARIIVEARKNLKKGSPQKVYQRLLLGMSSVDIVASFGFFFSTWPIPKEEGIYGSSGNTATCTAQGAFLQWSIVQSLYSTSLSIYYYLTIVRGWNESQVARVEKYMHAFCLLWGIITGAVGFAFKLFNNSVLWCWYAPYPRGCVESFIRTESNADAPVCTRGDNATIFRWIFFYGPHFICIVVVSILMMAVYCSIRRQEVRVSMRASQRSSLSMNHDQTQADRGLRYQVGWQALRYVATFYVTWFWPFIQRSLETAGVRPPVAIYFFMTIFIPGQGALNFLVYMRPKYLRYRRNNPELSWLKATCNVYFYAKPSSIKFRCSKQNANDQEERSIKNEAKNGRDSVTRETSEGNLDI